MPKLIVSVCKRQRLPWMTLDSFYVLISRVREMSGLRLLQNDKAGLAAVGELQPDEMLYAWEDASRSGRCRVLTRAPLTCIFGAPMPATGIRRLAAASREKGWR